MSGSGFGAGWCFGSTHSASGTLTPTSFTSTGTGTQSHTQSFTLNADEGTFSITITGSLNVAGGGIHGSLAITAPQVRPTKNAEIKSPGSGATKTHNVAFTVTVKWSCPQSLTPNTTFRVAIYSQISGSPDWVGRGHAGIFGVSGTASISIMLPQTGSYQIKALIEILAGFDFTPFGDQKRPEWQPSVISITSN